MSIALIGTRGAPARYGGFETAVEEIGSRLAARGHDVVVYCRMADDRRHEYLGMQLVHLPAIRLRTAETLSHTALSALHLHLRGRRPDVAIVFNAANAPVLPLVKWRGIPVALHVDGLEWQRSKWGPLGRRYYLAAERLSVRWADALIADAEGIRAYYQRTYGVDAHLMAYGAEVLDERPADRLAPIGLVPRGYHLAVARFEPENHLHLAVDGTRRSRARLPLVVVGSSPYNAPYARQLRELAGDDPRVRFLGAVWDQELLNELYANAATYFHGHSVGGTNPSLLRAMGAGAPVIAYDVVFNREVAGDAGLFVAHADAVAGALEEAESDPAATRARGRLGRQRVAERYQWDQVTAAYESLCRELASRSREQPTRCRGTRRGGAAQP